MRVRNASTGEEREVSSEQAAALYQSGGWQLPANAEIPVRTAHGNLVAVRPEQLDTAAAEGFSLAPESEFTRADMEARYSTPGQIALTGVEGVGRGLTLGFYDAIAEGIDDEYARDVAIRQSVNPGTAIAGEVVGTVAPMLVSGGSTGVVSGAVKGVGVLPRLASGAGRAVEMGVARAIGTGAKSVAGRAVQRGVAAAAGAAVESLPSAIGHQVSKAIREDREILSEQVLAGVGLETLLGGVAGGILGGGASLAGDGARAATRAFGHESKELPGLISKAASVVSGTDEQAIRTVWAGRQAIGQAETVAPIAMADQITELRRVVGDAPFAKLADAGVVVEGKANPRVVAEYLGNVTNPKTDVVHSQLRSIVDSVDTAGDEAAAKVVADLKGTLDDVERGTIARNQFKALSQTEQSGAGAMVRGLMGAVIGGGPGAAIGTAVGALSRPADVIAKIATIERVARIVDAKLDGGLAGYIAKVGRPARSAGVKAVTASRKESPEKVFERYRKQLATPPETRRAAVDVSTRHVREVSPELADSIAAKSESAAAFLESKLPRRPSTATSTLTPQLDDPKALPKSELMKFARYARAVEDPTVIVKDLAAGTLSRETVEAIATVYPTLYARVRETAIAGLANLKTRPPYQARVRLSMLLNFEGDPSLRPIAVQTMQSALTLPPPTPPSRQYGSPAKSMSESVMGTLDRLEGVLS